MRFGLTQVFNFKFKWRLLVERPQAMLIISFAALIFLGTGLLLLPISTTESAPMTVLDALFTATSAVCVTGLITLDTQTHFTRFGQSVVLVLIQLGGLGVMTFALFGLQMFGRKLSLRSKAIVQDAFWQRDAAQEFLRAFSQIVILVLTIEFIGAVCFFVFMPAHIEPSFGDAVFSAAFHSISAFCNAGFSTYSSSMTDFRDNAPILAVVMVLIVLGGLGHTVILEVGQHVNRRYRARFPRKKPAVAVVVEPLPLSKPAPRPPDLHMSLHARVVIRTSLALIAVGTVAFLLLGMTSETAFPLSAPEAVGSALFQSVSARTAGFNTIDIGAMPGAAMYVMILLMYVGGSPASCAGGIKTTSLAIWLAQIRSRVRGGEDVTIMGRHVNQDVIRRTMLLINISLAFNLVGFFVLIAVEPEKSWQVLMFEQVSAFATVGLSTGITPALSAAGKIWIVVTMFVGRLGPLTFAMWMIQPAHSRVRFPEGKVMIG